MKRREFIKYGLIAASGLLPRQKLLSATEKGQKKIVVVGAGLSGLSCAFELKRLGHEVILLEAQNRVGGRVRSIREPFVNGQVADAGATWVLGTHHLTNFYINLLGVKLRPYGDDNTKVEAFVKNNRFVVTGETTDPWPLDLSVEEKELGFNGLYMKTFPPSLEKIGDPLDLDWPTPDLDRLDRLSYLDFLQESLSPAAIRIITLSQDGWWGDFRNLSALAMLRDAKIGMVATTASTVIGGTDVFPQAFARHLTGNIFLNSPVVKISQFRNKYSSDNIEVEFLQDGKPKKVKADYAVCTVPTGVLNKIEFKPNLSREKQELVQSNPSLPCTRIYIQTKTKILERVQKVSTVATDLPIMNICNNTINQDGETGIIHSYSAGEHALDFGKMHADERHRTAIQYFEKVYPGISQEIISVQSVVWKNERWFNGAYTIPRPGQVKKFMQHRGRTEGRILFASDDSSPWTGWMQGALHSGLRAAAEINSSKW
ncbi:MAG: hypothetical protein A4S09_09820 [Proteobacteria bacterium SG_bin7]|nr:MAG: hypothetical protein A4S09_09820 [Proteobacteria bacterium SG_bin7]